MGKRVRKPTVDPTSQNWQCSSLLEGTILVSVRRAPRREPHDHAGVDTGYCVE